MPDEPQTAPELPHTVAKEYGVQHRTGSAKAASAKTKSAADGSSDSSSTASETAADLGLESASTKAAEQTVAVEADATPSDVDSSDEPKSLDENPETDAAVDSIVKEEGDTLLDIQPEAPPESYVPQKRHGFGRFLSAWWRHKWSRWLVILLLLAAVGVVVATPRWRYAALNKAGVRSSASVVVVDNTTQLPLKNVTVALGGTRVETDVHGIARLTGLRLGAYTLSIGRLAFASSTQQITIGWGSNPLGTYKLSAVGIQYTFMVTDAISGKPIAGANAENTDFNALSDDSGKVTFTVNNTDTGTLTLNVSANGYRSESVTLDGSKRTSPNVALVSSQKAVFMSTTEGKYSVYTSDLDGQNKKLLLAGTGTEGGDNSLVVSPDNTQAALVSMRDTAKDAAGYALATLTFINIQTGASTTVDHAEQIAPVDWIGDRLVYRTTAIGDDPTSPARSKLVSYTYATNAKTQLATASQFNAIISTGGALYYSVSGNDPHATLGMFKIQPDGSGKQQILDKEVWSALHTTYNVLNLQTPDGWYAYTIGGGQPAKTDAPTNFNTYLFADSPSGQASAWVLAQGGQGILQLHQNGADKQIAAQPGLVYPLHWLSDTMLVYRVASGNVSSDYVVSTQGGTPHKITDVTPTFGYVQAN